MGSFDASGAIWLIGAIQIVGISSAWLARASEGSRRQRGCQWLFLFFLTTISAMTMVALAIHPWIWMPQSVTLALMALTAVWDFRRVQPSTI